ncbi:hypothetical protein DFQ05_0174 [Winogradskyella wandonensis]|uniref:Lipoprotein n=1 Tax=Winogradskyella wandonensis TaxID=1442586 RepID=A0A4R1KTZ2_9FLAO|nr:hypothetical protein [Winogradskyella wandonensis]TCK68666.1 hypothetical protein DFQ05_0174 [Winogradskyella wandonensis]
MRRLLLVFIMVVTSCSENKTVLLPEIENAEITNVLDVSSAYIFYDETQQDSTLFNRKNIISTTNWLVNVDKRLTLKQVLPHLQYLQNKRRKASMHKNENAKNYFTCNDTTIKNLGFLEFTDVNFNTESDSRFSKDENLCWITFESLDRITTSSSLDFNLEFSKKAFKSALETLNQECNESSKIVLFFNTNMSFQDYIEIKSEIKSFETIISNDELFFPL